MRITCEVNNLEEMKYFADQIRLEELKSDREETEVYTKLTASGAYRWMACPPSAKLEDQFPDENSGYAAEGKLAHSLAELLIRYHNHEFTKKAYSARINKLRKEEVYSEDMEEYILDYVDTVQEIFNKVKESWPEARLLVEQKLDFSEYVPNGSGTGDVVIVADDMVQVIKLKYGKAVCSCADETPQLRLYAAGAYLEHSVLYDIRKVKMTIIQPRIGKMSTEELTVKELLKWAEREVKPKAELAVKGGGEYCIGDHCRFCKAKAVCRARYEYNQELTELDFCDPDTLEEWEIGEVLKRAEELKAWVKDVADYVYDQILNKGKKYEGWKLVEGRSSRKYLEEGQAAKVLIKAGYKEEEIFEKKLLGITAMEKKLGKQAFRGMLGKLVFKPEGTPVLVPETDKRPEINIIHPRGAV